jgi:hypothetical protein
MNQSGPDIGQVLKATGLTGSGRCPSWGLSTVCLSGLWCEIEKLAGEITNVCMPGVESTGIVMLAYAITTWCAFQIVWVSCILVLKPFGDPMVSLPLDLSGIECS